jgi:hypothetical protein
VLVERDERARRDAAQAALVARDDAHGRALLAQAAEEQQRARAQGVGHLVDRVGRPAVRNGGRGRRAGQRGARGRIRQLASMYTKADPPTPNCAPNHCPDHIAPLPGAPLIQIRHTLLVALALQGLRQRRG